MPTCFLRRNDLHVEIAVRVSSLVIYDLRGSSYLGNVNSVLSDRNNFLLIGQLLETECFSCVYTLLYDKTRTRVGNSDDVRRETSTKASSDPCGHGLPKRRVSQHKNVCAFILHRLCDDTCISLRNSLVEFSIGNMEHFGSTIFSEAFHLSL